MNDLANHEAFLACALRQPRRSARFLQPCAPLTRSELSGLGYEPVEAKGAPVAISVGASIVAVNPLVGGIIMGVGGLMALMGKLFGPNPKNVPAAQAEQVFEAASNNAYAVSKAGMVSRADAIAAMRQFLAMGTEYITGLKLGTAGSQAVSNMTKTINAEISAAASLPEKATKPLDLAAARAVYTKGGGWYPAAIEGSRQLTDQWLATVPSVSGVSSSLAAAASSIGLPADVGGLLSNPLVVIGLIVGGILLFSGGSKQ